VAVTGRRLRVNYLLEDTALFGGVKVPLHQANLLHRRGHQVRIISRGPRPDWYELEAPCDTVPEFSPDTVPEADVHLATYWTTIGPATSLGNGQVVHYCQGFEATYTHNRNRHPEILEAYRRPLPSFVVSPHLAELLRVEFGRPARVVTPALEPMWRPRLRFGPRRPPRVLVVGPIEIDWKGAATALQAIRILRGEEFPLETVRISQWPLSEDEQKLLTPDEFYLHLPPTEVVRVMAGCDLLLAPSWEQEGFGLPALEAMACGVPVVGSLIRSFTGFAAEAAELVPPDDAAAFAAAARSILEDRRRWRQMRRSGLAVARRFAEKRRVHQLEKALYWAADGSWRQSA
jgi:glycosyltransferase involved in cell wall biosynthesis